jgi:two-component sensor histidine kinase
MTSELVTNAIKYTACCLPGGQVLVSVRAGETGIRVNVTDQGPVYPCFPVPGGLGLGLVLVRQLADACGSDDGDKWFALRTDADQDDAEGDEACPRCGAVSWE